MFPKADFDRYRSLVSRASFNQEFWRGTIQDQSSNRLAMSYVGTPRFTRIGNVQALAQTAYGQGTASVPTVAIADVTGGFTVEFMLAVNDCTGAGNFIIRQGTAGGGFSIYLVPPSATNYQWVLVLYDAGGVGVRYIYATRPMYRTAHLVVNSRTGGSTAGYWVNGVPGTPLFVVGAASANIAVNHAVTNGTGSGLATQHIMRTYPFDLTNDDASCLYAAARSLVSG